ncbi:chaperone protein dnaJ 49-like [Lolium rigidum]|uniref:chaperone protein dnaJ 49-like n=1 Tax=Lolium rigidum TaxID=89674 RepID=UPI001F5C3062|nr:chaperone protein dnaJ 49-like [Lolium rigidum]
MEGNKDEALRSVKLAEAALASGDRQRADKFIRIAQRLDPSLPIADLLTTTKKFDPLASHDKTRRGGLCENQRTPKECAGPSSSAEKGYSDENVRVVRDIRKKKDYYAILGVERSSSLEEIRKAYRRLSLKIHPDKNKAPGAEDAFKMVSKAFKCLGNDQSRKTYDQTGALEGHEFNDQYSNATRQRTARRRRQPRNGFYNYEEDIDPDEIFRSFFYGTQYHDNSFRAHNANRARGAARQEQQRREHPVQGGSVMNLTILVHVGVLLLFVLLAFIPVWQPEYALQKTYNYPISTVTEKHGVEYFVSKQDFDLRFPQGSVSRDNLEEQVFRDYRSMLGRNCRVELHRRKWAKNYPTPHCDKIQSLSVQ